MTMEIIVIIWWTQELIAGVGGPTKPKCCPVHYHGRIYTNKFKKIQPDPTIGPKSFGHFLSVEVDISDFKMCVLTL